MTTVAIATPNALATEAAAQVVRAGGNAVDAAVAAMVVACTTEPGICSLGGGGYATVAAPAAPTVTIDGYVAMPGVGRDGPFDEGFDLSTGYGGGVDMIAGHGSIGTPGTPQMLLRLHELHGRLPWAAVLDPAVGIAQDGFPLGHASDHYMDFVSETLYGWHEPSYRALHHDDGRRLVAGDRVRIEHLDDTLRTWQLDPTTFWAGEVADLVLADCAAHGAALGPADLSAYEPVVRDPLTATLGEWRFATNPPPAIGGVALVLSLLALGPPPAADGWSSDDRRRLVAALRGVLEHRVDVLDLVEDRVTAGRDAIRSVLAAGLAGLTSPSTVHVSTAGRDGHAVALTCSSGYGAGAMPPGTGVWMNNCLGERELVRRGRDGYAPGERLPSNMAPSVGTASGGRVLAIGSPGADRITSALTQTLAGIAGGMELQAAVDAPRVHLTRQPDGTERLDVEEGVALPVDVARGVERRSYPDASMYFGGVAVCAIDPRDGLTAAADPRRDGRVVIV